MAIKSGVITFSGAAQALNATDALNVGDEAIQWMALQPDGANGAACYLGNSTVSATTGIRFEAGAAGVPPAPFQISESMRPGTSNPPRLSEFFVFGTAAQKLRVLWVPA
jgi:hypothetical protein